MNPPEELFDYMASHWDLSGVEKGLIEAHNSMFEFLIWHHVCHKRMGWPELPLDLLRCSMSKALAWSLPGALDKAIKALDKGLPDKDVRGKQLLKLLSVPKNPSKKEPYTRRTPATHPAEFAELYQYCLQDIVAERALSEACPHLSDSETEVWLLDQKINARGVAIDTESLEACINVIDEARNKYTLELQSLTGGAVRTVDELVKIQGWLAGKGFPLKSIDAEHVADALKSADLPNDVRRVLEIRGSLGARSVKKLYSIKNRVCEDGRIRGIFMYCGANRTGRFAGRGPQPQNLPRSGPPVVEARILEELPPPGTIRYHKYVIDNLRIYGEDSGAARYSLDVEKIEWSNDCVEQALEDIKNQSLSKLQYLWGDAVAAVSGCLRGLFVAAPGKRLICSDYSAIEAVVLAFLAGEQWRMDVFNTHGKIYEMTASKITGIPFDDIVNHSPGKHPSRKLGKTAELASGYGGWLGAWKAFGADEFMDDQEIKRSILKWREDSPMIEEFWGGQFRKHTVPGEWYSTPEYFGLEGAVVMAMLEPGKCYRYRSISYGYDTADDVLYCKLPSGRCLSYHKPMIKPIWDDLWDTNKYQITYMGHNSDYKKGPIGWLRMETYAGKLAENVTQAVARDVLVYAMVALEKAGYPIVLHVHDEIVCEVPDGQGSVEEMEKIMSTLPPWCADWPIVAKGGWEGMRYKK
jgi:DNA polymerase